MPVEYQSNSAFYPVGGAQYQKYYYFHSSERSPRGPDGQLRLVANPWSLQKVTRHCSNWHAGGPAPFVFVTFWATSNDPRIVRAQQIAQSDLRGRLAREIKNKNAGSLGVSIAQSGQAISMMRGAATSLISIFEAAERFYRTTRGKRRAQRLRRLINRGAVPTAGMVLAGFFGWAPLFEDFRSAMKTLADPWPPSTYTSVYQKWETGPVSSNWSDGYYSGSSTWRASGRETFSCAVAVSNPNLWIANKLGLVNPFQVAWDIVPWSFLVNMVTNMGQIMGSLTDFAGLTLSDTSLTSKLILNETASRAYRDPRPGAFANALGQATHTIRGRRVGVSPPGVTPYVRFVDWKVGTAAIIGSLLIQKVGKLDAAWSRPAWN